LYNVPLNDPLLQSLEYSNHVTEPSRDGCDVSVCSGSGYLIRRSALDVIGGWQTDTLADDTVLSLRLLGAGWRTAYLCEELQWGTVPVNFHGHVQQHTRRMLGTLHTTWNHRFFLFGPTVRRLTYLQRFSCLIFSIEPFAQIFLVAALLIIPSIFMSGGTVVAYATNNQLRWLIRLCFISLVLARLQEWTANLPSGYRLAQHQTRAKLWMTPYTMIAVMKALLTLPRKNRGLSRRIASTGPDHERSIYARLINILYQEKVYIHIFYLLYLFLALEASMTRTFETGTKNSGLIYALTHVFFPPVMWFSVMMAFLVPIRYAIWPPVMLERQELLQGVWNKGVVRPKREWRKRRWRRTWLSEIGFEAGLLVTTVFFFGTFVF
jgi:cellulose synthase/poly-beta-1,6-N-acetylglucosamine synthase-like glycosyltransferase